MATQEAPRAKPDCSTITAADVLSSMTDRLNSQVGESTSRKIQSLVAKSLLSTGSAEASTYRLFSDSPETLADHAIQKSRENIKKLFVSRTQLIQADDAIELYAKAYISYKREEAVKNNPDAAVIAAVAYLDRPVNPNAKGIVVFEREISKAEYALAEKNWKTIQEDPDKKDTYTIFAKILARDGIVMAMGIKQRWEEIREAMHNLEGSRYDSITAILVRVGNYLHGIPLVPNPKVDEVLAPFFTNADMMRKMIYGKAAIAEDWTRFNETMTKAYVFHQLNVSEVEQAMDLAAITATGSQSLEQNISPAL